MKKNEWDQSQDVEALIRFASQYVSSKELLAMAVVCCRELLPFIPGPIAQRLLEVARNRTEGTLSPEALKTARAESEVLYNQLYPGFGAPSVAALALTAIGELAFTRDEVQATVSALTTATEAKAVAAGLAASGALYDQAHDAEFKQESRRLANQIRSAFMPFG